jgi:hypothetical protein
MLQQLRPNATSPRFVPCALSTINIGISRCSGELERVILVRPGVYTESVRVTDDVTLVALGAPGAVQVVSQGWEPALVLGGFTVGRASLFDGSHLAAASAGSRAHIHGFCFSMRNQQQSVAVYCTSGQPTVTRCSIRGTVRVSGERAAPTFRYCSVFGSRSCGVRVCDHASPTIERCMVLRNRLAAVRISHGASPKLNANNFEANGCDELVVDGEDDVDDGVTVSLDALLLVDTL